MMKTKKILRRLFLTVLILIAAVIVIGQKGDSRDDIEGYILKSLTNTWLMNPT